MAAEGQAAEAAGKLDILGHIQDKNYLDVPIWDAHHLIDGRLNLIELPPVQIMGLTIDFSITKHVVMMWLAAALVVGFMLRAFRRPSRVPRGMANLLEAMVVFVRDDIVYATMGERGRPYLPYLLTVFFFILTCNLLGLIPYAATATGNISVTAALAFCTFIVILIAGIANNGLLGYFRSLVPHGVPAWLLPIMIPVEVMGVFARPFALCIRLFANMMAGHVVILALLGMIFLFGTLGVAPVSVAFAAAIYLLEIFVALVQAFIFTLLSSLFIGMAAHPEH
jgi:F-type H+-transporting ATPase subunit a